MRPSLTTSLIFLIKCRLKFFIAHPGNFFVEIGLLRCNPSLSLPGSNSVKIFLAKLPIFTPLLFWPLRSSLFRRALAEVRVGKARRDALRDIVPRTEVSPLTNFIGAIIQAEQLGVSVSKVLQVQSEQLRIERRQRAEEQAAKAPIKMLFPLVGCIFPSLFIVILGPAIILIVQNLSV
jgi:hypothetical protein